MCHVLSYANKDLIIATNNYPDSDNIWMLNF